MRSTIQFGPQHPLWVEPLRLKLTMDGEIVKDCELEAGLRAPGAGKEVRVGLQQGRIPVGACLRHLHPASLDLLLHGSRRAP